MSNGTVPKVVPAQAVEFVESIGKPDGLEPKVIEQPTAQPASFVAGWMRYYVDHLVHSLDPEPDPKLLAPLYPFMRFDRQHALTCLPLSRSAYFETVRLTDPDLASLFEKTDLGDFIQDGMPESVSFPQDLTSLKGFSSMDGWFNKSYAAFREVRNYSRSQVLIPSIDFLSLYVEHAPMWLAARSILPQGEVLFLHFHNSYDAAPGRAHGWLADEAIPLIEVKKLLQYAEDTKQFAVKSFLAEYRELYLDVRAHIKSRKDPRLHLYERLCRYHKELTIDG
jgi:hypothetical protein